MQPENFIASEAGALSETGFSDEREPGFKRTMVVIVAAHIALISLVTYFESEKKQPLPSEQITWMDADSLIGAASAPLPELVVEPEPVSEVEPDVQPEPPPPEPVPDPLVEPKPEIAPEPEPKPEPKPEPEPEIAPKPKPKPEPVKPKIEPKPDKPKPDKPKPVTKPFVTERKPEQKPKKPENKPKPNTATANKKADSPKPAQPTLVASATNTGKESPTQTPGGSSSGGTKPGGISPSELSTYFRSVGERFRSVWNEPVSVIGTGRDLVAYVRIRVKADGTVESATLNGSSGSREMDDSIQAAFSSFKNVPPPPAALLKSNGCMEETMEVKLGL